MSGRAYPGRMIRFLSLNAFIGALTIILCLWGRLISFFDRDGHWIHRYAAVPWAKAILYVCGVKLRVRGFENLDQAKPRIYICNHQSYFDILTLLAGLPVNFKFILKKELMNIPILGPTLGKVGYISIDRSDIRAAAKSIHHAVEKIKNGMSVLIFPEGTRSKDGRVQSFKKGGFHLALRSGSDIVPIAISGSRNIVPKGSLRIKKGAITMSIGIPISVKDYSKSEIDSLIARSRDAIIYQIKEADGK